MAFEQNKAFGTSIGGTYMKKTSLREWIVLVLIFVVLLFIIPSYIMRTTHVNGDSMENTLYHGEYVIREKVTNYFSNPKRFDVIVFHSDILGKDCIKRVIGLPGETVQIIEGEVYINEEPLDDTYGKEPISEPGIAKKLITLSENEFFVLGDNREDSLDSRAEGIGPITKSDMDGRVIFRIWPLKKMGMIN